MPDEVIEKPIIEEIKPITGGGKPKADDDTALIDELIGDKDLIDLDKQEGKEEEEEEIEPEKEELEDKEEDLLEDKDTNIRAVDFGKIKEKYPDFAKTNEYRELKNAYYREGKLSEIFPTVEDAQEAAEDATTFNKINESLLNDGDASVLLGAIKNANPEALKKVSTSFLQVLHKIDNPTYVETITTPIVKSLARQIYNEGARLLKRNPENDEGKALVATARNIAQYAFQDVEVLDKDDPAPDNKLSEKEQELSKREQAIRDEKFNSAYSIVSSSIEKHINKTILDGLDPDGKLNEFTRDALLEKIKKEVQDQISKDGIHIKKMTSLWKRSETSGFNRESLSSIVSAYLERARPIIPAVRNKFRSIAIKEKPEERNDDNLRIVSRGRSGRAPERDGKVNLRNVDTAKIDYSKTSDADIFEGKVKLKG